MIFKQDDDTDANNYGPIALLSNFNRILKKKMCSKEWSLIEQKNLSTPSQYSFRKAHSTQHAILDIVNAIQTNMDNRLFSCGIFIGLKKALDTVDHEILLRKLDHYGFSRHHKHLVFFLLARANSNNVASTFDVLSRR